MPINSIVLHFYIFASETLFHFLKPAVLSSITVFTTAHEQDTKIELEK